MTVARSTAVAVDDRGFRFPGAPAGNFHHRLAEGSRCTAYQPGSERPSGVS